jgi:ribosomal protein L11
MKKRYGFDSVIGKKSTLRFPRLVSYIRTDIVTVILPAGNSLPEAPFNTTVTMKKGDSFDICDHFNDLSSEYEVDFPIRINVTLSGPITIIELKTPTIFSMVNIIYNLDELLIEKFRASIMDISINNANFALAKLDTEEDFFISELLSNIKSIYSNLLSYNCRRRANKSASALLIRSRRRRFLSTNDPIQVRANQRYNHRRYLHFVKKTNHLKKLGRLPEQLDRLHCFYDCYEDWDELFDWFFIDTYLKNLEHVSSYMAALGYFETLTCQSLQACYLNQKSPSLLSAFDPENNLVFIIEEKVSLPMRYSS